MLPALRPFTLTGEDGSAYALCLWPIPDSGTSAPRVKAETRAPRIDMSEGNSDG